MLGRVCIDPLDEGSIRLEIMKIVIITHDQSSIRQENDVFRVLELPGSGACRSEFSEEIAIVVENLNSMV